MSDEGFVLPMCETLNVLLGEAKSNDEETRVVIVLQTRSFFQEIIPATHIDSTFLPDVVANVHTLFRIINDGLKAFLKDEATAQALSGVVSLVSQCEICAQFGQDLSVFVLGFVFSELSEIPGYHGLLPCIGEFFQNPNYPPFFEALGGLLALWDLLLTPEKRELGNFVFEKVSHTLPLYFQLETSPDYINFLSHVQKTLPNLPENDAPTAFQFLFDLLSNAKGDMLSQFIALGGFEAINKYIVAKNDSQLLIVYQMFRAVCVSKGGESNPILGQLIDLVQSPDASEDIQNAGMMSLFNTIRQFDTKETPLQAHQLYTLGVSLHGKSGVVFIDMCYYLATHFQLDISAILPAISKLFTAKTALEQDISSLFEIFQILGDAFRPFASMFYAQKLEDVTCEQFAALANKYAEFLNFFPMVFEEGIGNKAELFLFFVRSCDSIKNQEQCVSAFTLIMMAPQMIQVVIDVLLTLMKEPEMAVRTMKMISQAAIASAEVRKSFTEMGIVTIIRQMYEGNALDNVTILNVCAALSGGHFDLVCDTAVSSFLRGVDYLGATEDSLIKLAFGLQQEETELRVGHLCYPSLLHKCGAFTITSDYDLWICGQYAIDNWMRETGKPIAEFPSILNVAKRFLLPRHVPLMFDHPRLFAEACNDTFGLIPLFEFVKDCSESHITVPVAFSDKSVSFWIRFKELPPTSQQICVMDGITFKAQNDEFQINDVTLCEYHVEKWYHIVITSSEKGKCQTFIDQTLKYTGQSTRGKSILFGTELRNDVNWFIGGAIRIYDSILDKSRIENIAAFGLTDTISHEPITIQPSTFIQLFEGFEESSMASAGENARPVLSFPLSNHIRTAYGGNEGIFAKILELLADDRTDDCRDFLNALCNLQAQRLSKWSSQEFAVHISMLIHMCPTLVDVKTFDNIIESFSGRDTFNDTFDWFAFLTILLDFGLLNSPLRSYMISKLFGFVAQFPPSDSKSLFGVFVFEAFHMIDFDKDERISFGELIKRFDLKSGVICRMIASLPNFAANITVPSLKYEPSDDSPLFDHLLEILTKFVDFEFNQTYLFHVLPPNCSLDLIYQMILSALSANKVTSLDQLFISKFCITYCYIPKAWSCVLTLLTGVAADAEMSLEFECPSLNAVVFPSFLLMVSLLVMSSVEMTELSYWRKLTESMLKLLNDNVDKLPAAVMSKPDFLFALMQLTSFGLVSPFVTLYPFAPSISDAKEAAKLSVERGQHFPEGEPQPCPFPTFQSYAAESDLAEKVHSVLMSSLPKDIKLLPGKSLDTPYNDYRPGFCAEAVDMNRMEKWTDWRDFMKSIRSMFGLSQDDLDMEKVLESDILTKILKFVAGVIVKSPNANILSDLLSRILLSNTVTRPRYSMTLMERLSPLILEELTHKSLFSVQVIQFLCERLKEGWFANSLLSMISLMVLLCEVCDKPMPDVLADVLIDGFDLVEENDCDSYLNFMLGHSQCIFSKSTLERTEFCVLVLDRLLTHSDSRRDTVSSILQFLCDAINSNEELHNRWTKNVLPSCPDCDLKLLSEGLSAFATAGVDGWNSWREKNVIFEMDWSKLRTRENMKHCSERLEAVTESLSKVSDQRIQMSSTFFTNAYGLLGNIHNDMTVSKAVCACLRHFQRERLLIAVSYFMRQREMILTKEYRFDVVQSNIKALTLLSDPLIPSKRVEKSPLVYVVPPFPRSDCLDVQPEIPEVHELLPLLPDMIKSLLVTPYFQFEDFVFHTKKQLKLSFSQVIPISDSMNLGILQLIMNDGKKFEAMWNLSLLYGVDPLPGIALKTSNSVIFVEGMELTETGIRYRYSETPRILYTFYMSYFIAGHFGPCSLMGAHPVVQWPTDQVIFSCRHYWLHRPTAVEVTFISGWSFILIPEFSQFEPFFSMWKKFVDETLSRFPKQSSMLTPLNSAYLLRRKDYTKLWQEGIIDNFTYLCILNRFGCRSLADYTQYYVFPWVVGDYNSSSLENAPIESFRDLRLPMGQIGRERAPRFDMVFEDSDNSYFYGTHYMHLGVVLYYMFRIDPFCLFSIYLHHGWDHQNRLFYDVYETWMAAGYTAPADVKELIPEFFCVPEFLVNLGDLPLTTTTEGKQVANVNLGHWCNNPYDFVHKMQYFLQCDMVTEKLSNWIDLIFGYKSRGEGAVEAKNLFHPLCYVRPIQDEAIESEDEIEREAAITCIINFGQCCMQLFHSPHPQPSRLYNRQHIMTNPDKVLWQRINTQSLKFPVSDVRIRDTMVATASGLAMLLPPFFSSEISLDSARLCISVSSPKPHSIFADNFLDSTKTFCVSKDGVFMGIGQIEGSASLYLLKYSNSNELVDAQFVERFATNGAVSLMAISSAHFLMLTASGNQINRIDIGTRRVVEPIEAKSRVNCLIFDDYAGLIIAGGYSSISIWNVSGTLIADTNVDSSVVCIDVAELPEVVPNRFFVTGHSNGCVKFWTVNYSEMKIVCLKEIRLAKSGIRKLSIGDNAMKVIAATLDEVYCLDYVGSPSKHLNKIFAVECCHCKARLEKTTLTRNVKSCSACHRFLCKECIQKEQSRTVGVSKRNHFCPHCFALIGEQSTQ